MINLTSFLCVGIGYVSLHVFRMFLLFVWFMNLQLLRWKRVGWFSNPFCLVAEKIEERETIENFGIPVLRYLFRSQKKKKKK